MLKTFKFLFQFLSFLEKKHEIKVIIIKIDDQRENYLRSKRD